MFFHFLKTKTTKESNNLAEEMSCEGSGSVICDECEDKPATIRCDECRMNLCNDCDKHVHSLKIMSKHTRHSINETCIATNVCNSDVCESCESVMATIWCNDCQTKLCENCNKIVHSVAVLADHDRCSVGDVLKMKKFSFCQEHKGKKLELHCNDCNRVCCEFCFKFGEHKDHKCDLIVHVIDGCKKDLQDQIDILRASMDGVVRLAEEVAFNLDALNEEDDDCCVDDTATSPTSTATATSGKNKLEMLSSSSCKHEINHYFDKLMSVVESCRNRLLLEADKRVADKEKLLRN